MLRVYDIPEKPLRDLGYGFPIDNSLRLEGVERVDHPSKADVLVLPIPIREKELPQGLLSGIIDHFKCRQEQIVAFDCSDFEAAFPKTPNCIFIRCNLKGWMKRQMPRSIAWPWPVEDLGHLSSLPEGGFKYDVGFQGWVWSNVRHNATQDVLRVFGDRFDCTKTKDKEGRMICGYKDFYGYIEGTPEGVRRKAEFQRSLHESKLQLAPQSIHSVFPYRFYEAISAGRVPVLFCDDYCLPWSPQIPWDEITIRLGDQDSVHAGSMIKGWLNDHDDADILRRGALGREMYQRYLHRDRWNSLFTEAIVNLLKSEGTNVQ